MTTSLPAQPDDHPLAHLEHPYPWYDAMRGPPRYSQAFGGWLITRFVDIVWILERPDLFSARDTMSALDPLPPEVEAILATGYPPVPAVQNSDGVLHQRLRALVEQVLVPCFKHVRSFLRAQANALVDGFLPAGQADLMEYFSLPLAFSTFCELLGIPAKDQAVFRQHCDATLTWVASLVSPLAPPLDQQIAGATAFVALQRELGQLCQQRRHTSGNDVISALAHASLPDAPALGEEELVAVLVDLVFGGYKTTASLIGTSIALLAPPSGAWQELQRYPARIALAVEEALRIDAPVQGMVRTTTQTVLLPDTAEPVPPDSRVLLLYGAANRDPVPFPHADQVDWQRKPNRHLAFGHGIHTCVGAPLARLEGQVALETLTQRLPQLRLSAGQDLVHIPTLMYRGLMHLLAEWR